jgi:hypothetical protein
MELALYLTGLKASFCSELCVPTETADCGP